MIQKILQVVLPFWLQAKRYTDSRMKGLVGLAYSLTIENGVMRMTVHDSRALTASLADGTFTLNNQ